MLTRSRRSSVDASRFRHELGGLGGVPRLSPQARTSSPSSPRSAAEQSPAPIRGRCGAPPPAAPPFRLSPARASTRACTPHVQRLELRVTQVGRAVQPAASETRYDEPRGPPVIVSKSSGVKSPPRRVGRRRVDCHVGSASTSTATSDPSSMSAASTSACVRRTRDRGRRTRAATVDVADQQTPPPCALVPVVVPVVVVVRVGR